MPVPWVRRGVVSSNVGDRRWRWASIGLFAGLGTVLAFLALSGNSRLLPPLVGMCFIVYELIGVIFAVRAWRHRNLEGHSKPWVAVLKISNPVTVRNTSGKSVMIRW